MDILWTGLAICVVVGFVFYVLVTYWQRLLRSHSRAIRHLSRRLEALEGIEDPRFRRRLGDSVPSPLGQVYVFSFRLGERFWTETLGASKEEMSYVRSHGKFLGSIKIERWRSHFAVAVTEVLPQSLSAGWQTRSIDIYPAQGSPSSVVLWDLPLGTPEDLHSSQLSPRLELRLEEEHIVLRACEGRSRPRLVDSSSHLPAEKVIFRVPLDTDGLSVFRAPSFSDDDAAEGKLIDADDALPFSQGEDFWLAFYRHQDDALGIDWQLCLRDLDRKTEWERWKIAQPGPVRRAG